MAYRLRPFEDKDAPEAVSIFHSNLNDYFDPSEEAPFRHFLKNIRGKYFVCEQGNKVLGCGGYAHEQEGDARICWLMVDREVHASGVGRFMMDAFQQKIETEGVYHVISLQTSQHTDGFYEKLGYTTLYTKDDHWAPGMHLYYMEKQL
jgi:N-acetylglutamate synthase-like GNAT family acetyltransferase